MVNPLLAVLLSAAVAGRIALCAAHRLWLRARRLFSAGLFIAILVVCSGCFGAPRVSLPAPASVSVAQTFDRRVADEVASRTADTKAEREKAAAELKALQDQQERDRQSRRRDALFLWATVCGVLCVVLMGVAAYVGVLAWPLHVASAALGSASAFLFGLDWILPHMAWVVLSAIAIALGYLAFHLKGHASKLAVAMEQAALHAFDHSKAVVETHVAEATASLKQLENGATALVHVAAPPAEVVPPK